jgi:hypothetical protein
MEEQECVSAAAAAAGMSAEVAREAGRRNVAKLGFLAQVFLKSQVKQSSSQRKSLENDQKTGRPVNSED